MLSCSSQLFLLLSQSNQYLRTQLPTHPMAQAQLARSQYLYLPLMRLRFQKDNLKLRTKLLQWQKWLLTSSSNTPLCLTPWLNLFTLHLSCCTHSYIITPQVSMRICVTYSIVASQTFSNSRMCSNYTAT